MGLGVLKMLLFSDSDDENADGCPSAEMGWTWMGLGLGGGKARGRAFEQQDPAETRTTEPRLPSNRPPHHLTISVAL